MAYYDNKLETLKSLFGVDDVALEDDALVVAGRRFPIIDDVIILLKPDRFTHYVAAALEARKTRLDGLVRGRPDDIQSTFGEEWQEYHEVLAENRREFDQYFDLIDVRTLKDARVCDVGCGNGRWSFFLKDCCREIILLDFSDAIFVARRNLSSAANAVFFMGDLQDIPFTKDYCDLIVCFGVLHHLPTPCLDAVRALRSFAPRLLVFVYYALDNRPAYFRPLLRIVTVFRRVLWRIQHPGFRRTFSRVVAAGVYRPLVWLGSVLELIGLGRHVPLYEPYRQKSFRRIEQDVYDRFFTRIEQRVTRQEILRLRDSFTSVTVSDSIPYWHFLCIR